VGLDSVPVAWIGAFEERRSVRQEFAATHSIVVMNAGTCCSKNLENDAMRGGSDWYGG
jgi:hypothetical protein